MNAQANRQGGFTGAGGLELFRQSWRPDGPVRGVLVYLHGLGDHSGLYVSLADYFVPRGLAVHAPDLRGNGRSRGQRGYVAHWSEYREDLARLLDLVRGEEPGLPLFLLGNSLGGLIVLDYVLHHGEGIRGVIAIAPPLGAVGVPAPLLLLGRVLSRVWPRFSLKTGMDLSG
ncbi:MAG: alpha/beta fold hydrolase, partial [Gemmatimonadales bacterium]